jgi:GNAT superfamily N-acetyltransferase
MSFQLEAVDPQCADALALLREAAIDARALYPEQHTDHDAWPSNPALPERGVYVLARLADGSAVASGALWPLTPTIAELRRMYVHRDHRRRGLGGAMLDELVRRARALGFTTLRLETGMRQQPAIALYERAGFYRIAAWGAYVDDPTSVCFECQLAATDRRPD